jgi:nitric oxide reductase NorE protein
MYIESESIALIKNNADTAEVKKHIPGEEGIWVFVLGDMMVFALFFCIFTFYRSQNIALYELSRQQLNMTYGVINTLLLLASSWFVVTAVTAFRKGHVKLTTNLLAMAFICGLGFSSIKILEYSEKISHGITVQTNEFFMFYFVFTGIHFLHVLIGMSVLTYFYLRISKGGLTATTITSLEGAATYWHMVDLLWIALFPLLYMMG